MALHVREHAVFTRDGRDLRCLARVGFSQLALGAELRIPTLDGSTKLQIPAGTQSGASFRLRGKGATSLDTRGSGDLYVEVCGVTPKKLNAEQRQLFETLAEHEELDVDEPNLFDRVRKIFS